MALTDNCDLYVAVHEDGVNQIIGHIMRQRPSLFNYGTIDVALNPELWCEQVSFTPDVINYGNPIFSIEPPVPVLGSSSPPIALGFCAQVTKVLIDFAPGNVIALPSELSPPLQKQRFALQLRACAAIECPSDKEIDSVPIPDPRSQKERENRPQPPVVLRGELKCFCLDVFVIGHFEHVVIGGQKMLTGKVDGMDIVDIKPEELEDNMICYLRTAIAVVLRQKLTIPLSTFAFSFPLFGMPVTLTPTPNPPVPNNPAIEDDQLKAFITMTV